VFEKYSIWPYNRDKVIDQIRRPKTPLKDENKDDIEPPLTSKRTRKFHKEFVDNPDRIKTEILFEALRQLQAEKAVLESVKAGLVEAIVQQKKKVQGKALKLNREVDNAGPQLMDSDELIKIKEYRNTVAAETQLDRETKAVKKAEQAKKKAKEEEEKARKAA